MNRNVFALFVTVAILAMALACSLSYNRNDNTVGPNPVPTSTATPTPNPRPTIAAGDSDVSSMAIFLFGYDGCKNPPENSSWVLPMDCRGNLTATPKRQDNSDAVNHGNNLTWSISDPSVASLTPQDVEPTFNRTITPLKLGTVVVTATLVALDGKTFVASRVITVNSAIR